MNDTDTRDPTLPSPFDALRTEMASLDAPRGVHKELMAAFAAHHRPRRWIMIAPWRIAGAVGTAAAVLLAVMSVPRTPFQPARDDGAFIALDSFERIAHDPAPRMLETTVPRASLAALGVPVNPENAGDMVQAEMLVGFDGHPLALRLASE
jgi:hypothetical protein